jgi:phosphohistidine phosphatase
MAPKHLALLRHAKSSWSDSHLDDHDRPLTPRGHRAATRLGLYLRQEGIQPDLVLCSSAARARQTLGLLGLATEPEVLVEDELYAAAAAMVLARLRRVSETAQSVLLIGHNPGIQDAAISLASDPEDLVGTFPTAALADLRLPIVTWQELCPGIARLHALVVPRNLR